MGRSQTIITVTHVCERRERESEREREREKERERMREKERENIFGGIESLDRRLRKK